MLQDIKDDLELMTLPDDVAPWWWVWAAGGAVVVLLGVGLWLVWRWRKRIKGREETPEQVAAAALARLKAAEGRALYRELSEVLAKYLTTRCGVGRANLTSQEIRVELRRKRAYGEDARRAVDEFLDRCDRGKFGLEQDSAAADAAVAACKEAIRQLSVAALASPRLAASQEVEDDTAA